MSTARNHRRRRQEARKGAVSVLAVFMFVMFLCIIALSVDLGYLMMANTELQRTADSAALAATWELIDDESISGGLDLSDEIAQARVKATQFVALNRVCAKAPTVDPNEGNETDGDVLVGYLSNPSDAACAMTYDDPDRFNAVRVKVRKTAASNGEVPLFFARIWGMDSNPMEAEATAALLNNIGGFRTPPAGHRLDLLPFALDEDTWNGLMAGGGTDTYGWSAGSQQVQSGGDGIREVNLYPQGTGSPGNRGTVDIGGSNNSTADIARQIVDGINEADLDYHGGELVFDGNGELELNGDTGISAGVKDELASITGQTRIIPVFSQVQGPGNNAQYTIVMFVGVRIMNVKLTGSGSTKRLIVQPANVQAWGGIPSDGPTTSNYVYSPVWLVR
jgi:Flp pilus assembly protein TadG